MLLSSTDAVVGAVVLAMLLGFIGYLMNVLVLVQVFAAVNAMCYLFIFSVLKGISTCSCPYPLQ